MFGFLNCNWNSVIFSPEAVTADPAAVCLLRMLSGMSSLSLLVVPCPQLELLLFCFLAGGEPSAGCLSRLSRTDFAFFGALLLAEVDDDVTTAVVVAVVVTVVAVTVLMLVVSTATAEFTAAVTDFASLLLDFRFLDRKTISDVGVATAFATGFST
jgi:hypothetical protein